MMTVAPQKFISCLGRANWVLMMIAFTSYRRKLDGSEQLVVPIAQKLYRSTVLRPFCA